MIFAISAALGRFGFQVPRRDYKNCRGCGRHCSEVGPISHARLCFECGRLSYEENIHQLRAHSGPFFQHYRRRCVAAYGGVLLDDLHVEG